MTTKIVE